MTTCFAYDGTFTGFLSVIFEVYDRKAEDATIVRGDALKPLFCDAHIDVGSDAQKAARVTKKIIALCGSNGLRTVWKAWLSEQPGIDQHCLEAVRYAIKSNSNVLDDYGHAHVLRVRQAEKLMHRESHRMEAFMRFRLGSDGVYVAAIEPDFNVLPIIEPHFRERYADQRWLIFDQRRRYGIYYDLHSVSEMEISGDGEASGLALHAGEEQFAVLWKDYFSSTNIKARKNMKLHLRHVPRRYWKLLTEKHID